MSFSYFFQFIVIVIFNRTVPLGMERFNPVLFLDLNGKHTDSCH